MSCYISDSRLTVLRRHILNASRNLALLDDKQVQAVASRIELDLRIGYAFTRFLTLKLRELGDPLRNLVISYGKLSSYLPIPVVKRP